MDRPVTATTAQQAIPVGLATSGSVYSWGFRPDSGRQRITTREFMDQAVAYGLSGVELPARLLAEEDANEVSAYARERGLFITVDTGGFEPEALAEVIELAAAVGSATVRTLVGGAKIGGDRRPLAGRWKEFIDDVHAKLRIAATTAERAGVNLALENHQDLASEELLWLCESIDSPKFGITLDTGNPLATAEEPLDYVRRVAPYVKNVHLKDYWTWLTEEGYRLVRCPLGQGLVDFPDLLDVLGKDAPDATMAIELGALEARHIRVLAEDFWPDYPKRTPAQLAAALRVVQANARPAGDWRTPYEKGEPPEAIAAYEDRQLEQSLAYVRTLLAGRTRNS